MTVMLSLPGQGLGDGNSLLLWFPEALASFLEGSQKQRRVVIGCPHLSESVVVSEPALAGAIHSHYPTSRICAAFIRYRQVNRSFGLCSVVESGKYGSLYVRPGLGTNLSALGAMLKPSKFGRRTGYSKTRIYHLSK
jgi:hypothetical protein